MLAMSGRVRKQSSLMLLHVHPLASIQTAHSYSICLIASQGWRRTLVMDDLPKLNKGLFTDVTHGAFVRSWSKHMAALKRGARVTLPLSTPHCLLSRLAMLLLPPGRGCMHRGMGLLRCEGAEQTSAVKEAELVLVLLAHVSC